MKNALQYSLVRYQPHMSRHEVVNIGVVLFTAHGPEVYLAANLKKLQALDPNISMVRIHKEVEAMDGSLKAIWHQSPNAEEIVAFLSHGKVGLGCMPVGMIDSEHRTDKEIAQELLQELVTPPAKKRAPATSKNRLNIELRHIFSQAQILGREPGDIAKHMVVPNFPIDPEVGLYAEFALRNGRLHVTETVDFRVKDLSTKKREAESKALVLLQALETVGKDDLRRHVVVSGADADVAQTSIHLLSRYADDVFVRESHEDWTRYLKLMEKAAHHGQQVAH